MEASDLQLCLQVMLALVSRIIPTAKSQAPRPPTAPHLQAPTYALKVSVMRAKNLLAKDPNGEWGASRVWGPRGRGWD